MGLEKLKQKILNGNGKGGEQIRVGLKFLQEIEDIITKRLRLGTSNYRISREKITNALIRHKNWGLIKENLINLEEGEFERLK